MRKLLTALLSVSILFFTACKKDDKADNKAELLIGKSWKITGYTEGGVDMLHEIYDDCELDNITTFLSDGRFKDDEGAVKCDDEDPQVVEGTWKLSGKNLIITEEEDLLALNLTIVELNGTTLKLSGKNPFTEETMIITFTAQ